MPRQPNFLVILADDLGFSDLGCFGGEIRTPNLDQLAAEGSRFVDFHAAAACSPTRSMLMSGTDHHLTGLGQLIEFVRRSPAHHHAPGHEGFLSEKVATLPEVLRTSGGYHTFMAGKWHLGLLPEYAPVSRGFDRSFAMLAGCSSHYGFEPQLQEELPPQFFQTGYIALHIEDDKYQDNAKFGGYYSSDLYSDKYIEYLKGRPKDKPFFSYLTYTAPHWPLQAPEESSAKYRGVYDKGPGALRESRLKGMVDRGIIKDDVKAHPFVSLSTPFWDDMTPEQQAKSARSMEVYAGMVDRVDYNLGRIFQALKDEGVYDDTVILFMSDNGAEGAEYEAMNITDDIMGHLAKYYDNSLDNIGKKDSFVWYGNMWAQAATAPSRLFKMHSTEGGIKVPLIIKGLPGDRPAKDGGIEQGGLFREFCTVMDVMPTFLDLAGVDKPGKTYNGREVLEMRGESWANYFRNTRPSLHSAGYKIGWELVGHGAFRDGDWKANFVSKPSGPEKWQLYNLENDPGEIEDLAEVYPEKLAQLVADWEEYARTTNVVGLRPEYQQVIESKNMDDPRNWMKFDTSFSVMKRIREGGVRA